MVEGVDAVVDWAKAFETFAARKLEEASTAHIEQLSTILDLSDQERVLPIGNAWTRGAECMSVHASALRARPWIRHIPLIGHDIRAVIDRLRHEEKIRRISTIGGRFTATRIVDAGLAQDIYLTTTSLDGGEPQTPWYDGPTSPRLRRVTAKQWLERGSRILFEHIPIAA